MDTSPMIEALLHEREAYVKRGLDDRVAQVDEQLTAAGHGRRAAAKRERAVKPAAEKRG